MIHIQSNNVLNEPRVTSFADANHAMYVVSKKTILYHGLKLWCHLYNKPINKVVHLADADSNYIYFNGLYPLTSKTFSKNFLNDAPGINQHGNATPAFVKYLNKRYKVLYTRDLFDVVNNAKPSISRSRGKSLRYYMNLRTNALKQNIERGILHVNYNYNPYVTLDLPHPQMFSKGQVLAHYLTTFPYEQLNKHSFLYHLISLWMLTHHMDMSKTVIGFQQDKNYIYFGMTNIPRSKSWKFTHPNHYSDVDYYLLGGNGNGLTMKSFIKWTRTSSLQSIQHTLQSENPGFKITRA